MKKGVVLGVIVGAVAIAIAAGKASQTSTTPQEREAQKARKREEMFKKFQANWQEMPDDFPPVVFFDNVAAIRENTDEILRRLDSAGGSDEG